MNIRFAKAFLALISLSACGDAPSGAGPGGVSAADAKALDEAAAKLDAEATMTPTDPRAK